MMKTLTLTSAIALVMIAGHAQAQELTYGSGQISGGYLDLEGDEITNFTFEGDIEVTFDQFVFGASGKHQVLDQGSGNLGVTTYDGFAGYMVNSDIMVGAGLTGLFVDGEETYSGYEAFAQYDNGQYAVALVYERPLGQDDDVSITSVFGQAAVSSEVTVGAIIETVSELDETIYYLSADYDAGPISARGFYHGVTDIDAAIYGARASYDLTPDFFGTAALQRADGFFGDDFTVYSVGGGYRLSEAATVDASIGQMTADGAEATMFQIGLTFETGGRKRLDGAMTDGVRADLAQGISQFAPDMGFGSGINFF